jgi:hypothetical protein
MNKKSIDNNRWHAMFMQENVHWFINKWYGFIEFHRLNMFFKHITNNLHSNLFVENGHFLSSYTSIGNSNDIRSCCSRCKWIVLHYFNSVYCYLPYHCNISSYHNGHRKILNKHKQSISMNSVACCQQSKEEHDTYQVLLVYLEWPIKLIVSFIIYRLIPGSIG